MRVALTYMHCCVSNRRVGRGWGAWNEGSRGKYLWLIHVVSQKLTQHCKAIILQLSKKLPFLKWCSDKEPFCQCRRHKRQGFDP